MSSRRFVGREPQLAELSRVLDEARHGRAWIALIGGESGVGKSRLVDELVGHARAGGARALVGDCVELAEGELPYAPLIGALRPLMRSGDPALDAVRAELDRPLVDGAAPPQGRFFELLLDTLDRLAADAPLVIVLEDIHWADRSTRDFLAFAARNLCRENVLLVATYRSDELHRRHPLRPLLPELERLDRTALVLVERLTRDELRAQLADILGEDPEPALVDRLFARCEGNPLFAEELLAAGLDGRGDLPPTLRDALMVRVEALAEPTQVLLRVVAAAARADEALLAEVGEVDAATLRPALREALAHNVLALGDDGRYAFRHALLREAMHEDLLPGEVVELHLRLARALERRADAGEDDLDTVTEVAHHFAAAGEQPEALGAAVRAADAAERIRAPAEAATQLERALSLWPRVPDAAGRAGLDHVRLLERLAVAANDVGDFERARHATEHALGELDAEADPRRAARLLEHRGSALWHMGRGDETMASYERGLTLLERVPEPCVERALTLAAKAKTLMLWGRYAEAIAVCEQTLEEAEACGARGAEANARNTLGVALASHGSVEEGIAQLQESMAIDRRDGRTEQLGRGHVNLGDVLLLSGRAREALALLRAGIADAEQRGRRATWMRMQVAETLTAMGELDAAEAELGDLRARSDSGAMGAFYGAVAGEVALARGDEAAALTLLDRARGMVELALDPQWHAPLAAVTAHALRRERRLDEARAILQDGRARLTRVPGMQDHARLARLAAADVAVEADTAERGRDLGDAGAVEGAVVRARAAAERARAEADVVSADPWVAEAEAELTRAEGASSPAAWAAAAQAWTSMERAYPAAEARWRQAEACVRMGHRERAAELVRETRAEVERMGSRWLIEELGSLTRRARLRLDDEPAAAEAQPLGEASAASELGLTPREQEVLALVASGATNREIGEALFMAEKTASVHVSRILAKLDVRTRTEAGAVAHRLGLAGVPTR